MRLHYITTDSADDPNPAPRLPDWDAPAALLALYDLPGKLARVQIEPSSPLVGQTLAQASLRVRYRINVVDVEPQALQSVAATPRIVRSDVPLQPMDVLLVKGTAEDVARLAKEQHVRVLATGVSLAT